MNAMDMQSLRTFDRVVLLDGDAERTMDYDEFMALPLDRRVRWLLQGRPRFFLGSAEIPRKEALSLAR